MAASNFLPNTEAGRFAAEYADKVKKGRMTPFAAYKAAYTDGYIAGMTFARQIHQDGVAAITAGLEPVAVPATDSGSDLASVPGSGTLDAP